jgi:tRNA-dihydrouridine synthase B
MTMASLEPESERLANRLFGSERTFFAPMEGVTHPALREMTARRGGVGVVCTEFVRVTKNPLGSSILRKHVVRPSVGRLSVQVMGNDIAQMAEATSLVTDAGADIVDINLGCPAPRAVRKGVGSAMLKDLSLLGQVLDAMRKSTKVPLSAKIRAGFDDASRVLEIARMVQEAGCDFIAIHPRRRVDFYDGVADWRIIRHLASELTIPVVGNGDIWYASDALRMRRETGCAAVMLGRPALRNPWVFVQIDALHRGLPPHEPNGSDVVRHVERLSLELGACFPEKSALGMLKEQMRYLCRTLLNDQLERTRQALRCKSTAELLEFVGGQFSRLGSEQLDLASTGGILERSGSALDPRTSSACS